MPEMYGGPTTLCEHWAELWGHDPSAGAADMNSPSAPPGMWGGGHIQGQP